MLEKQKTASDNGNQKGDLTYLWLVIFLAGAGTMMVEFAASRLLGNVFGTSNLVWAVVIGLVLVYLTLGNWLGGKWADKHPLFAHFFGIIALAGVFTALVPIVSRALLSRSADAFDQLDLPILAGAFITVLVLFILPITLLGMVTPFALKLTILDTQKTGSTSGKLSAISTIGSFLGTFLTVLVLIPQVGTYRTFIITSLLLLIVALPGLYKHAKKVVFFVFLGLTVLIAGLGWLGVNGLIKSTKGMVYETESAYNYIQVLEEAEYHFLRLNEGQGMHSIWHPQEVFYSGPWSQPLVATFFNPPEVNPVSVERIAVLGLAGGTTARQASIAYPDAKIDGWEIDPEIIRVGNEWFGMDLPNLTAIAQDARWGIRHSQKQYDVISIDAYRPPYIPPHMVTVEFFREVAEHLSDRGAIAINIGRGPADRSLLNSMTSTVSMVFPSVFVMDLPNSYNSVLFATKRYDSSWENFETNLAKVSAEESGGLIERSGQLTLAGKTQLFTSTLVFTDDKAPIESVTNRMVLNFLKNDAKELE